MDIQKLTKKNQEFIRIAKHQLLENGKTEEEAESLIQEILPAIHENQGKGIPARTLFGAPTVWANSFSEKERYEKEQSKISLAMLFLNLSKIRKKESQAVDSLVLQLFGQLASLLKSTNKLFLENLAKKFQKQTKLLGRCGLIPHYSFYPLLLL